MESAILIWFIIGAGIAAGAFVLARSTIQIASVGYSVLEKRLDPRVATISTVFAGANWHERETWEMFGFWFDGHPNLIHIYLPGAFEGYPLRKDFPLLAREVKPWPGLTNVEPIAGEADAEEADA